MEMNMSHDLTMGVSGNMTGGDMKGMMSHGHSMGSMGNMSGGEMKGMAMTFHWGFQETILFSFWKVNSQGMFIASCTAFFFLGVIYEGLKVFREYLLSTTQKVCTHKKKESKRESQGANMEKTTCSCASEWRPHHPCGWPHIGQTFLHLIQVSLSYFLMLVVMTLNVWLCLAVILGAGGGYFLFGWKRVAGGTEMGSSDHCQ